MLKKEEKKELMDKIEACLSEAPTRSEGRTAYTEEEKVRAAYALNLCTVSVSQIIEYRDLRFMEQEYENILNNLNLEMMPKDEALLDILKQILDVISYFRIEDGERKMLEKEYRHRMKNAIWSAVPNPSVILSSGGTGLWGLATTLALSVGTGYMNYRKEKASIDLENERKEWELQRSALEQLHGLRRELFETAWRLADNYGFADDLRLSERRITQYNEILLDENPVRRYERLCFIADCFKAYPPFLYHQGSAALQAANDTSDEGIRRMHIQNAVTHFEEFVRLSGKENKLLREDPTVAQCAFEYIAALDMKEKAGLLGKDESAEALKEKKKLLLDMARRSAGNALDTLQLCAVNYMALGETERAKALLRMLVNESYNTASNAQLLSALYVAEAKKQGIDSEAAVLYRELSKRLPEVALYPMPTDPAVTSEELDRAFCERQRKHITDDFVKALGKFLDRSRDTFDEIWDREDNIIEDVIAFFRDMTDKVSTLYPSFEHCLIASIERVMPMRDEERDAFYDHREIRKKRQKICFDSIVRSPIKATVDAFREELMRADTFDRVMELERILTEFCAKNGISLSAYIEEKAESDRRLESALTGRSTADLVHQSKTVATVLSLCKNAEGLIDEEADEVDISYRGDRAFKDYIQKYNIEQHLHGKTPIMLIADKKGQARNDLLLTEGNAFLFTGWNVLGNPQNRNFVCAALYKQIICDVSESSLKLGTKEYREKGVHYKTLFTLIEEIKKALEEPKKEENDERRLIDVKALFLPEQKAVLTPALFRKLTRSAFFDEEAVKLVLLSCPKDKEGAVSEAIASLLGKKCDVKHTPAVLAEVVAEYAYEVKEALEKVGAVITLKPKE